MTRRTRWSPIRDLVVGGGAILLTALAAPVLRRRYNRAGATDEELTEPLPGDELVRDPELGYTRAVTIDAPPEAVWPWLAQIGQGRGGFYSFDTVENLIGCGIHSVDEILPELQHVEPGDLVRAGRDTYPCWTVMEVDPPHHLVLQGSGTPAEVAVPEVVDEVPERGYVASTWHWVLRPLDDGRRTRLVVRQRCTYRRNQAVLWHVVEPLNYVMEREMLRGVAARAEEHALRGSVRR